MLGDNLLAYLINSIWEVTLALLGFKSIIALRHICSVDDSSHSLKFFIHRRISFRLCKPKFNSGCKIERGQFSVVYLNFEDFDVYVSNGVFKIILNRPINHLGCKIALNQLGRIM